VPVALTAAKVHLGVALEGAGWHPGAWRLPTAAPDRLFDPTYWVNLVQEAEAGLLDFASFEDALRLQSDDPSGVDGRTDRVRGRLDAVLVASRVAPATRWIGLVPSVTVTHTEPFHLSKAIATLDYVSRGRAGVRVQVSARADEARHFGRRTLLDGPESNFGPPGEVATTGDLLDEAADWVEVVRRLWDSWEDDAEIRDGATGRFIDRDKLHYVDFASRFFSVRGPSITPRPPQGQPLVAALAHGPRLYHLLATAADLGFVTPKSREQSAAAVQQIALESSRSGRAGSEVAVLADLVVLLHETSAAASQALEALDELAGTTYRSDAAVFAGTTSDLANLLEDWFAAGLSGFRLRPARLPSDLEFISRRLVPELQRRGLFRSSYEEATLRGRFGWRRPINRYAPV
jgi:alkanesulfonate monooxygenase SsuD/methylene tetrahydromethanopterin reductase-like flavin-dependent oxidoreductase (luciferase family)